MTRRAAVALLLSGSAASAKKKKKKKGKGEKAAQNLGLLAGTVFTPEGRSAPGVKVTAWAADDESERLEGVTDYRGEFALRAPVGDDPAAGRKYRVVAEAKGFEPVEKTAEVYPAQKTNVNLILEKP